METLEVPRKLWEHPNPESTLMYKFMQELNRKHELQLKVTSAIRHSLTSLIGAND